MPHSSGGGSHGGGSHGGSHHSSHSSGRSRGGSGSSQRTSSTAFAGATRYVYYRNKRPYFVYSNYDIRKKNTASTVITIIFLAIMALPILGVGIAGAVVSFETPKKVYPPSNKSIVIEDELGVIDNEDDLIDTLEDFRGETGIVPAVVTISEEKWNQSYPTLEDYAYDKYLELFKDEKHWLIVYSSEVEDDGFDDWKWEGMQGNDTDNILTVKKVERFNEDLHKMLLQRSKYSVGEAIEKAFDSLNSYVMNKTWNKPVFFASVGVSGFFLFFLVWLGISTIKPVKTSYYHKAIVCDETLVDQEKCEYCGGVYVVGLHKACPHCAAPLPVKTNT